MTTFNVADDATGGGLSANALALGADSNLVFTLTSNYSGGVINENGFTPDGLLVVQRPFRIKKLDALVKGKFATTHLHITAGNPINGKITIRRNAVDIAQVDCSIAPAGQIPAPSVLTDLVPNPTSNQLADVTKGWSITAVRKDASGKTTQSGASQLWLGKGAALPLPSPVYEIRFGGTPDITTTSMPAITVVPYDKVADKEGMATTFTPQWSFGTFTNNDADVPVPYGMPGSLPEGTVVNFAYGFRPIDDTSIILGNNNIRNYTVDAQGGVACYGGGGGYERVYHNTDSNTYIVAEKVLMYKLSTHSQWKVFPPGNSTLNVVNSFAEGTTPNMVPSMSVGNASSVYIGFTYYKTPIDGPNFSARFELKMFCEGRQVSGTGAVKVSGADWPADYDPSFNVNNTSLLTTIGIMSISSGGGHFRLLENYNNQHLNYTAKAPRGDQYYTAGLNVGVTVSIPPVANATGIEIYARPLTYNQYGAPGSLGAGVPYQLIYDGPPLPTFEWTGTVLNPNYTAPTANTTANYPASYTGSLSWPPTNPDEIEVLEGDQVICYLTAANLSFAAKLQALLPIEF